MRHLLDITDLGREGVTEVVRLAHASADDLGRPLVGQGVALIFEKPSNRTRHSMEMAVVQLGGHPVYTRGEEVGFDTRETVEDVTAILAGYHGVVAARVHDHRTVARMAALDVVPIVNMLSDRSHPLQALADVMTMVDELGDLDGRTVSYVGEFNNVARSLAQACVLLGANVRLGCPPGYGADDVELDELNTIGAGSVSAWHDPLAAADGADAVHTDTWTSMGHEGEEASRAEVFRRYQVDAAVMAAARPSAIFLHCMPAHRGLEVAADVFDGPASRVIRQGHNRMHAARGALVHLLAASPAAMVS